MCGDGVILSFYINCNHPSFPILIISFSKKDAPDRRLQFLRRKILEEKYEKLNRGL